ncbi:hypothetical protein GGI35DRAFT_8744 [Trichoderma velutinum]
MRRGNLYKSSIYIGHLWGPDTATMQNLGTTLLLGAAKIWAASNSLILPISHISAIFPIAFIQYQRLLVMSDQGSNFSLSYKNTKFPLSSAQPAKSSVFRNPVSLSDNSAQSHSHERIQIKRNFYQASP